MINVCNCAEGKHKDKLVFKTEKDESGTGVEDKHFCFDCWKIYDKDPGYCEACGEYTEYLENCSDPDIGADAAVYSACSDCTNRMRNKIN